MKTTEEARGIINCWPNGDGISDDDPMFGIGGFGNGATKTGG